MSHERLRLSCRLFVQNFVIVMLTFRDRWQSAKHMFSREYSKRRSDYRYHCYLLRCKYLVNNTENLCTTFSFASTVASGHFGSCV